MLYINDLSEIKFENQEMGVCRIIEIKGHNEYKILKYTIDVTLLYAYNSRDIVSGKVIDIYGTILDIKFIAT